jgi:hypothetical protein
MASWLADVQARDQLAASGRAAPPSQPQPATIINDRNNHQAMIPSPPVRPGQIQ